MKFAQCHHIFHGTVAFLLLMHALGILEAESMLLQQQKKKSDDNSQLRGRVLLFLAMMTSNDENDQIILPFQTIGIMIGLSMCSIVGHWAVLRHLRTTAPRNSMAPGSLEMERKKKQRLAYAYKKLHLKQSSHDQKIHGTSNNNYLQNNMNMVNDATHLEAAGQYTYDDSATTITAGSTQERESSFDEFFHELQSRLDMARERWTLKLEEVKAQLTGSAHNPPTNSHNNNVRWNLLHFDSFWGPTSPFRLLLQLFAYEDDEAIIGKLDALFYKDRGETLGFYVPQLLSFLLHGAYLNADALEAFLLDKCSKNLHFGHKCYWFLRAWCLCSNDLLEQQQEFDKLSPYYSNNPQADEIDGSASVLSTTVDLTPSISSPLFPSNLSSTNLIMQFSIPKSPSIASKLDHHGSKSKLSTDERTVVEDFMMRIIDCSGEVANLLQSGKDGSTCPSPLISDEDGEEEDDGLEEDIIYHDVEGGYESSHQKSSNHGHLFLATPTFLDSLLAIADDLMVSVPREHRTDSLRRKLKVLGNQWLPSNLVYIPLSCAKHKVLRIVAEESIALSTKERVPCIITLEVIDYSHRRKQKRGRWGLAKTDRELLSEWVGRQRPPQRHNTILEVISNYTNQGLKIIKDEIEEVKKINIVKGFLKHNENIVSYDSVPTNCLLDSEGGDNNDDSSFHDALESHPSDDEPPPGPASSGNAPSHRTSSRSSSPYTCMGQWSSPSKEKNSSRRIQVDDINAPPLSFLNRLSQDDSILSPTALKPPIAPRPKRIIERYASSGSIVSEEDYGSTRDNGRSSPLQMAEKLLSSFSRNNNNTGEALNNSKNKTSKTAPTKRGTPMVVFKEDWAAKQERIRSQSEFGDRPGWRLLPVLVKSNDDLRQEQLASQLIQRMAIILARANVPVWLCPYEILALTGRGGIIEAIPDTISIDSLKRNDPLFTDLQDFFVRHFGPVGSSAYADAKANFVESLAGYSIVCFILQIKDRHNGNILLNNRGHLIHIDFGFLFLSR